MKKSPPLKNAIGPSGTEPFPKRASKKIAREKSVHNFSLIPVFNSGMADRLAANVMS